MSTFTKSFLAGFVPLLLLGLLSTAGAAVPVLYYVWFLAFFAWVITVGLALAYQWSGRRDIAAGLLAAVGAGFLALAASCFANLSTFGPID